MVNTVLEEGTVGHHCALPLSYTSSESGYHPEQAPEMPQKSVGVECSGFRHLKICNKVDKEGPRKLQASAISCMGEVLGGPCRY